MTMRTLAGSGLGALLALLLAASAGDAQTGRYWNRQIPPGTVVAPAPPAGRSVPRNQPRLPNYYLDQRGPVAAPKASGSGDVAASLRARGFRDIGPIQQRGNTLIVPQATGPSGEKVQLVIRPSGEIVGVRVLGPGGR